MAELTLEQANEQAIQLLRASRIVESEALVRRILQTWPNDPTATHSLGLIAQVMGRHKDAVELLTKAVAAEPTGANYHYNLAVSLESLGQVPQAESELRTALRLQPDLVPARLKLGAILFATGRTEEAIASFREAARYKPDEPWPCLNLVKVYRSQDKLDDAETAFRKAITASPALAPAWNMLGSCLRHSGRIPEAIEAFRGAVRLDPNFRQTHSNLCYAMYFDPQTTAQQRLDEHLAWAHKFVGTLSPVIQPHTNVRAPDRRLRVAYVSPNFRTHVIGFFMEPILQHHDWEKFEVACYSDTPARDDLTRRLEGRASLWRDTAQLNDQQLTRQIREDGIDILVDLTLHMRGSRLGVFGLKPAPVQITHLAYCGTSGLKQMDWCITDPHMLAPGCENHFTEKLLPLAESYWCYRPSVEGPGIAAEPPCEQKGNITFGSLNTLAKANDQVLDIWAKLLDRVPESRLAIHAPGGEINPSIFERFAAHGIPRDRLLPKPRVSPAEYLNLYNQIDIALDPFPYPGGTTTFDALWMGVPVVTLAGQLPHERAGVSILNNLQLTQFIAQSPEQYLELAASLAENKDELAKLRSSLRQRLTDSLLLDAKRYVRDLEAAYRHAWKTWCG